MADGIIKSVPKVPPDGKCLDCQGRIIERVKMSALPSVAPVAEPGSGSSRGSLVVSDGHYCIKCGLPYIATG